MLLALCVSLQAAVHEHDSSPDWRALAEHSQGMVGAWSCGASNCHGGERHELVPPQRSGGELEIYRSRDPHGRAGELLETERFADILLRLKIAEKLPQTASRGYRVLDQVRLQECMNCHNPADMENRWSPETGARSTSLTFAIECETCHGSAQHWIASHARPGWNRMAATLQGFQDTKNLLVRGRACSQCHVGDANHDMNHDMIAAGHPPLRFELASYVAKLPKHWHDRKARTLTPHLELQLWLAGQIANFDSSLTLLESRKQRSREVNDNRTPGELASVLIGNRPTTSWPEFAEYSCTGCHQAITSSANWSAAKQRQTPRETPLAWASWNQGFMDSLLLQRTTPAPAQQQLLANYAALQREMETGSLGTETSSGDFSRTIHQFRFGSPAALGFHAFGSRLMHDMPATAPPAGFTPHPLGALGLQQPLPANWNGERAAHAYAFLVATVQSQYDEEAKLHLPRQVPAELRESLRQMKQRLTPLPNRPFGAEANVWHEDFTKPLSRAAQLVEGARQP